MPRRCTVCAHPEVEAINRALVGGALPYRAGVPTPESLTPRPGGPELTGLGAGVRKHLERWGMAEDWDKMQREGEQKRARKLRERRALQELERQADPFGFGTAHSQAISRIAANTGPHDLGRIRGEGVSDDFTGSAGVTWRGLSSSPGGDSRRAQSLRALGPAWNWSPRSCATLAKSRTTPLAKPSEQS